MAFVSPLDAPFEVREENWHSPKGMTILLTVLLVVFAIVTVLYIWSQFSMSGIYGRALDGNPVSEAEFLTSQDNNSFLRQTFWLSFLVVTIIFLMWVYRVSKNLPALLFHQKFSAGRAIGWWFVPIFNFFQPYRVVKEIWEGSHPKSLYFDDGQWQTAPVRVSRLLGFWWAFWLLTFFFYWITRPMNLVGPLGSRTAEESFQSAVTAYEYGAVGLACLLISGLFLAVMVIQISRNQERKHRAIIEQENDCDGLVSATS